MIPPEEFATMVAEDIKGKADSLTRDLLRDPSNQERWRDNLVVILNKVNAQINELSHEIATLENVYAEYDFVNDPASSVRSKLDKAERFRYHTEKRLAEADRLMSVGVNTADMKLSSFLRLAIEEHMKLKLESASSDDVDHMLWSALAGKWEFQS